MVSGGCCNFIELVCIGLKYLTRNETYTHSDNSVNAVNASNETIPPLPLSIMRINSQ